MISTGKNLSEGIMRKKIIIIILLLVAAILPAYCQSESSHQAQMTSTNANLVAANTVVTLVSASRRITIKLSPASSSVHLNLGGLTATTSNFLIDSGGAYQYVGEPIKSFAILPNGAVGQFSIQANN